MNTNLTKEIFFTTKYNNKKRVNIKKNITKINELLEYLLNNYPNIDKDKYIYINNYNLDFIYDYITNNNELKLVLYNCTFNENYIPIYNKDVVIINPTFNERRTDIFIEKTNKQFLIYNYKPKEITINNWNKEQNNNEITILGNYTNLSIDTKNTKKINLSLNGNIKLKINTDILTINNSNINTNNLNINYNKFFGNNYILKSNNRVTINKIEYKNSCIDLKDSPLLISRKNLALSLKKILINNKNKR